MTTWSRLRVCRSTVMDSTGIPKRTSCCGSRSHSADSTSTGTLWRITTMMIILMKVRTRHVSNV